MGILRRGNKEEPLLLGEEGRESQKEQEEHQEEGALSLSSFRKKDFEGGELRYNYKVVNLQLNATLSTINYHSFLVSITHSPTQHRTQSHSGLSSRN